MGLAFESVDSMKQIALPNKGCIIRFVNCLNRTKGGQKRNLPPFLVVSLLKLKYFIFSCPWTGTYTIGFSRSQAFRPGLNYTTSFPVFATCRQQIVEFLGLHEPTPHNRLYISIYLCIYFPLLLFFWRILANKTHIKDLLLFFATKGANRLSIFLSSIDILSHLILELVLRGMYHYHHFPNEESVLEIKQFAQDHTMKRLGMDPMTFRLQSQYSEPHYFVGCYMLNQFKSQNYPT